MCKNEYTLSEDGKTAYIKLTHDQVTSVDVEDLEKIADYRWYASWNPSSNTYYCHATTKEPSGKRKKIILHRLIMNAERGRVVDHIDTNTLNNIKSNLRICSRAENSRNRGKSSNNKSGHKGVYYRNGSYVVQIRKDGKLISVGSSKSYDEAVAMHESAIIKIHGEFARIEDSVVMEKQEIKKKIREPVKKYIEGYGYVYEIPLTKGQFAIIDIDDIDIVKDILWLGKWNKGTSSFYASTNIIKEDGRRSTIDMQRMIMGDPKGMFVDHINGNTLDNRRSNLRLSTVSENSINRKKKSTNTSGYTGVHKVKDKWVSRISTSSGRISLGTFETPQEAYAAYCKAALELHGEFARLT
jgi:hypothetical protein